MFIVYVFANATINVDDEDLLQWSLVIEYSYPCLEYCDRFSAKPAKGGYYPDYKSTEENDDTAD